MSSSFGASFPASLNGQVTEKLSRTNYVLWRTQIIPQLRGAGVFGYVHGTQPEPAKLLVTTKEGKETSTLNPLHPIWVREDQQVLGYLLGNLSKEVLLTVTMITTAGALWTTLAGMYSSQSASRINNIRNSLINAQKGNLSVASYFATMRGYADELAAAGKAILDDELISYIIHGLDADYQPLISALDAHVTLVTIDELFAMLSNFDQRMGSQWDGDKDEGVGGINKAAEKWMADHPLVGRESEMNDLRQHVLKACLGGFHVLSVWGMVGAGKSALVKMMFCDTIVNDRRQSQWCDDRAFDMYGWVDVSHPFDLRDFCRSLLFSFRSESIHGNKESVAPHDTMGSKSPIIECRDILEQGRCLVVIDGLKSTKEWDLIQADLVAGSRSNCIIVITNDASIATHCHGEKGELIFNVKGLQADAAFQLFKKEVSRKYVDKEENELPPEENKEENAEENAFFEMVELKELISKCGGLPKVIAEISSSLATSRMERIYSALALSNNFMHDLESKPEFDSLQGLIGWIHNYFLTCPDSLKPCIFYLSIFPRDRTIRRRRLVKRWIAEGYLRDNHGESAEESGEKHFSNLLDLSIIQQPPQKIASTALGGTRVVLCHVNGFIREYIASRRMEDNFVFELGRNCALPTQRTGRHLIIPEDWDRNQIIFKSTDFSRLRSLTVFGKWESFFISKSMKILRVLDLEDARGMQHADLEKMVKLLPRLKFLSLRGCREICHLPSSLGDLRQLQTLDVRDTSIATLPENIIKLQKLQYVHVGSSIKEETFSELDLPASAPSVSSCWLPEFRKHRQLVGVVVPRGIGKMTALHTLGVVNVAASGGKAVLKELKKLTQLRKLGVSGINEENSNEFFSAIKGHVHLESLSVQFRKDNQVCLDGIRLPFENLRSLKLYGLIDRLPEWSHRLSKLAKLHLDIPTLNTENVMRSLGELPELCILRLKQLQDDELLFCVVVNGLENVSFQKVKVLQIACGGSSSSLRVTFGEKTMKKLEVLKVDCCGGMPTYQFYGLEDLYELKQVLLLNSSNAQALKEQLESQLAEHPNLVKPVVMLEEPPCLS